METKMKNAENINKRAVTQHVNNNTMVIIL